jgi:GTP-binding protein
MLVPLNMKIRSAELHDQAFTPGQIPSDLELPQVAVFGRSNVGKSSLLATMMKRKKLVKISSKPGKTRGIFFYVINEQVLLVDMPGYGFSKAPKVMANQWQALVEAYLDSDPGPALALHLIDIRHPPTWDDIDVNGILAEREIPALIVATKGDKLSRSRRMKSQDVIAKDLGVPRHQVIPTSAKDSAIGADPLWDAIAELLGIEVD